MPVLFLLSGPKIGFSPHRGDTLPRETGNLAREANLRSPPRAKFHVYRGRNVGIQLPKLSKFGTLAISSPLRGSSFAQFTEFSAVCTRLYRVRQTWCWHVTISCQPDGRGRPPQPVRPWKSGRVRLAEGGNVVVLELPYSTEFGRESRKFASGVWKYGKFDDGRWQIRRAVGIISRQKRV